MRTLGLSAAVLAMSLAGGTAFAADDEKKPAAEQQGSQQQTMEKQQGGGQATQADQGASQAQSGSGVTQPTESPDQQATGGMTEGQSGGQPSTGETTEGQDIGKNANEQMNLAGSEGKELIGKQLVGADDQEVGEVKDVLMGDDGMLQSVLVDVGGFLGIGAKTVAIPADKIEVQGDKVIARDLTKESAENMKEYKAKQG